MEEWPGLLYTYIILPFQWGEMAEWTKAVDC